MKSNIIKYLLIAILIISLPACKKPKIAEEPEEEPYPIEEPTPEFDNSVFKQLTKEEAADLYNKNETQVVFICTGIDTYCKKIRDIVVKVQEDYNYTTNYIYVYKNFSEEFHEFLSKLDLNYKLNDNIKGTFYELLSGNTMYIPAFVIIKDGKQVDGCIGGKITYKEFHEMVGKYIK